MQQIRTVWAGLDTRKRVIIGLAGLAVIAGLLVLSRLAAAPSMKLLYAGLESGAAGDVVRSLEQRGVMFEVRGGSIYVPAGARDELRLTLASEGLPTNGGKGYELLDSLNGFGTTSQMFDAAYWRAKEGELARTILASRHIAQARVHIAHDGSSPFQRSVAPTASVSVVAAGAPVTPDQANAIRFLVASAVAGMSVENVAVIDANGSLLGQPDNAASAGSAEDRAQQLRERVLRLVEARVGPGNAVVEVSVDTVTETRSIRERRLDPESRIAISTDVEERADSSSGQSGSVTVASNLPDGDGAAGGGSSAQTSSTRERVNYEMSETELEIRQVPGAVRRLTVAVLLNGIAAPGSADPAEIVSRPEQELAALRELVASAVGFDAERGDVITLKSMDLPAQQPLGVSADTSLLARLDLDAMSLIQIAALALVTLLLGLFVIRPLLLRPAALPAPKLHGPSGIPADVPVLTGEIDEDGPDGFGADAGSAGAGDPGRKAELPALAASGAGDPVARLRAMIGERQEETVEILRSWLEEGEEA
ncbi:MAG: flagellar M-ring protein FliF [Rhodobacteraceae bacterium]|nr:flagellar M-ring protein FliF [Paracoccaceae bacterium]